MRAAEPHGQVLSLSVSPDMRFVGRLKRFMSMTESKDQQVRNHDEKWSNEQVLIDGLRNGNEEAFGYLLDTYYGQLLRVAMSHVPSRAVAEEVVQETWQGVLESLPRFEGRSSLKTWLFRILTNRAKTRGKRERLMRPRGQESWHKF